jgi:large subunit ribosomal protein L6
MSRIGGKPIQLKQSVKVNIDGNNVKVTGSKGELEHILPKSISLQLSESELLVIRENDQRQLRAMHGLTRSLLANMITGVNDGFKKDLEIQGIGYRAQVKEKNLVLNLGYSHPVEYPIPDDVDISVTDNTKISVQGIDKQRVGQVAATIRQFRKPEPYKGKGIRYAGEVISMKEGKTV